MKIITSPYLTEAGEPVEIPRTWKERLFTRPWRPLLRTRTFVPQVPMRGAFQLDDNTIVVHPAILAELKVRTLR